MNFFRINDVQGKRVSHCRFDLCGIKLTFLIKPTKCHMIFFLKIGRDGLAMTDLGCSSVNFNSIIQKKRNLVSCFISPKSKITEISAVQVSMWS